MTVTRRKKHFFLGMDIEFHTNGTVEIKMVDYLTEAIAESDMKISRMHSTPARKDLFDVGETATPLAKAENELFHRVVAKLLYIAIRARLDILLPVTFLCMRVSKATIEDQLKLKRVLQHIKGTLDYTYTLGADDLQRKSHTGGVLGRKHINTLAALDSTAAQERVEERPTDDSPTASDFPVEPKDAFLEPKDTFQQKTLTWADVVRATP